MYIVTNSVPEGTVQLAIGTSSTFPAFRNLFGPIAGVSDDGLSISVYGWATEMTRADGTVPSTTSLDKVWDPGRTTPVIYIGASNKAFFHNAFMSYDGQNTPETGAGSLIHALEWAEIDENIVNEPRDYAVSYHGLTMTTNADSPRKLTDDLHSNPRLGRVDCVLPHVGVAAGAIAAAFIAQRAGRKAAMLVAGFLFLLGTLLCALAPNVSIMIGGASFSASALGSPPFSAPLYIAEISLESQRGTMISIYQLIVCGGMLLAFLSDSLPAYGGHWRWMLGILLVPTVIFIIAMLQIPYSPRWLVADGQKRRARAVWVSRCRLCSN